jgi:hypothetical protein
LSSPARRSRRTLLECNLRHAFAAGPIPPDLAERAVQPIEAMLLRIPESRKHLVLSRLGAVLYRAGRPADAIRAIEDSIRRRGEEWPEDLLFLSMAHQQLGYSSEARKQLTRFEALSARKSRTWDFWERTSRDDLRREAESRVLLDPLFPASPFADPRPTARGPATGRLPLGSRDVAESRAGGDSGSGPFDR